MSETCTNGDLIPSSEVRQFADTEPIPVNLAVCPSSMLALDANATILWPVLLKKVGVTISKGEHIEDKPAWRLRNFGADDLAHRLSVQQQRENGPQDDIARAKIWRHVSEACQPGDSISDLTAANMYQLNAFIVPRDKRFATPLDALRKTTPQRLLLCANERCLNGPGETRAYACSARAKFCSKSCRNVVSRRDGRVKPSRTVKTTLPEAA
jgi:hypothetical protein